MISVPAAYYQNVMQYSAYWGISMFKCDILRSVFRAAPWSKRWKKNSEILQNFWVRFSITTIHFQCSEL